MPISERGNIRGLGNFQLLLSVKSAYIDIAVRYLFHKAWVLSLEREVKLQDWRQRQTALQRLMAGLFAQDDEPLSLLNSTHLLL
jgi:hypothetical protein